MTSRWEYCMVTAELYRDGTGGGTRELLSITRPGQQPASISNPLGLIGLLNELGADGWELVDVESGKFYLKRALRSPAIFKPVSPEGLAAAAGSVEQFNGEKRVNYFYGQLMSADDFTTEQQYLIGRRYLHNRLLHGWGIVSGLDVSVASDQTAAAVNVTPGVAIDRYGRELILTSPVSLALSGPDASLHVLLAYTERQTNPVPPPPNATPPVFSRIEEGVAVRVSPTVTTDDVVVLAKLLRQDDRTWSCSRV